MGFYREHKHRHHVEKSQRCMQMTQQSYGWLYSTITWPHPSPIFCPLLHLWFFGTMRLAVSEIEDGYTPGLCLTHESWVKFDSTLIPMSRPWKSRIWVESESNHADRHLSQSWVNWILLESKLSHWFSWRENVKILYLSIFLRRKKKQPTATFDRTPPPPVNNFLPNYVKCDGSWVRYDSTLTQMSWVRLVNLGFELSRSWVRLANLGFELSQSWVTCIVIWVRVELSRKKWVEHNPGTHLNMRTCICNATNAMTSVKCKANGSIVEVHRQ